MLNSQYLQSALKILEFEPKFDLFALRLNKQFENYCSYRPDPEASHIDAFSISWSKLQFYCFPPFSCLLQAVRKILQEKAKGIIVIPNWPTQAWYHLLHPLLLKPPQVLHPSKKLLRLPASPEELHPLHKRLELHMSSVRQQLIIQGISSMSAEVIMALWREGTKSQYQTYIDKWIRFCSQNNCEFLNPPILKAIDFLTSLFHQGLSYTSINTERSALSALLQIKETTPFEQILLVKRFMKGVFELRPSFPRYESIWDVNKVFTYFREKPNISELSLKELLVKLTFLLLLLSGQRCQMIHLFSLDNMVLSNNRCVFQVRGKGETNSSRLSYCSYCF